ncbi:MAG: hypothetical protein IH939_18070 [Acidobacteria bacterium]|nr:hypothetical protein [Acidobacteriota bacterium]
MSSPLLTLFRRADIPLGVRELAARGGLTWDAADQLGLLLFLLDDPDPGVGTLAQDTLDAIPRAVLEAYLARPEVTPELRAVFAARGVEPGPVPASDDAPPLVPEPVPDPVPDPDPDPVSATELEPPSEPEESRPQVLASLPVIDRIKMALRGTREQRTVLIRDPNKVVAVAVLGSPKLNASEVEVYARMTSVQEEVLRIIGTNRHWIKHYPIVAALVANAKTPLAIAMPLVTRLNERDLKLVVRDRNVSDGVRAAARKFVATGQARRR